MSSYLLSRTFVSNSSFRITTLPFLLHCSLSICTPEHRRSAFLLSIVSTNAVVLLSSSSQHHQWPVWKLCLWLVWMVWTFELSVCAHTETCTLQHWIVPHCGSTRGEYPNLRGNKFRFSKHVCLSLQLETPGYLVTIEQSQPDRSKKPFHPVRYKSVHRDVVELDLDSIRDLANDLSFIQWLLNVSDSKK